MARASWSAAHSWPLFACHGTPPAAGRAWYLAAVYGPSVRASFLLARRVWKDRSVIDSLSRSISALVCPAVPGSRAAGGAWPAVGGAPAGPAGSLLSAGRSVLATAGPGRPSQRPVGVHHMRPADQFQQRQVGDGVAVGEAVLQLVPALRRPGSDVIGLGLTVSVKIQAAGYRPWAT